MHSVSPTSRYQADIQGLRAVAVMLVVYYHAGLPGLPGGYVGVDVFFVISGYLITGLLLREIGRDGTISLRGFYARRVRRLLPAAAVVLLATLAVAWFVYSPLELKQFSSSAFATAAYASNLWFAHLSTDYLAEDTGANPLLHTWSLAVEEQFYLVWPFLLLAVLHLGRPERLRARLLLAFAAVIGLSLGAAVWLTAYNQPWAFFGSPTRAWEFALGGLVALLAASGREPGPRQGAVLGGVGLAMIMLAAAWYTRATEFPGWAAALPAGGAMLIVAASHKAGQRGVNRFLALPSMQFIGDISYSLYLWHWPVFVFGADWIGHNGLPARLAAIALVFVLGWLSLVLVENPVRFNRPLARSAHRGLLAGATLTLLVGLVALGVRHLAGTALGEPEQRLFLTAHRENPEIYANGCHLSQLAVDQPECSFGDPHGDLTLVLFGDSHAAHWFPALREQAEVRGWRLYSFTKSGCPSVVYEPFNTALNRAYTECTRWRERILARIAHIRPDVTVFTNSSSYVRGRAPNPDKLAAWRAGTEQALAALRESSGRVVLLRDTPRPANSIPRCLSLAHWRGEDPATACAVEPLALADDWVFAAERAAADAVGGIRVVDLNDVICPGRSCSAMRDGQVLFRDASHLAKRFARSLGPVLGTRLVPAPGVN